MVVLGVPLALPLAMLAFFSGYIPYFGGFVATGIILIVTYAALGGGAVVALLVLIGIRNAILGYGVRPAVYGKSVHIHPAMVLVVLPAGYELGGRDRPVRRGAGDRHRLRRRGRDHRDPRSRAAAGAARPGAFLARSASRSLELADPRRASALAALFVAHLRRDAARADPGRPRD